MNERPEGWHDASTGSPVPTRCPIHGSPSPLTIRPPRPSSRR